MPFRDIIGHTRALELLSRAVARDSLPPSQLFAGPSGVGKRLVAVAVAQAVNCLSPVPFPNHEGHEGKPRRHEDGDTTKARRHESPSSGAGQSPTTKARRHEGPSSGAGQSPTTEARRHESPSLGAGQSPTTKARRHESASSGGIDGGSCSEPRAPSAEGRAPSPEGNDACGTCASCTRIARGVHPDVVRLGPDEDGAIGIDDVRGVLAQVGYRPFEGRRRVVIIDEADGLGAPAQSGLLKTLEEPPPSTVFILVSARPDALLPTVLSRCSRLRFMPLGPVEIARALVARGRSEGEAHAVAAAADGSLSRALEARADDFVGAREMAAAVLRQVAHERSPRERLNQAAALVPKRKSSVPAAVEREQLAVYLRAMSSLLRDIELVATGADARMLANSDVQGELDRLSEAYAGGRSRQAFAAVDRALGALHRNASAKIVADWLVMQI